MNNYTYTVDDTALTKRTLVDIQQHLTEYRAKYTIRQSAMLSDNQFLLHPKAIRSCKS